MIDNRKKDVGFLSYCNSECGLFRHSIFTEAIELRRGHEGGL